MLSQTRLALTAVVFALAIGHMAPARGQTESKVIASDGKSAMDCTALEKISEPNAKSPATQWVLVNRCTDEVEFGWCVDDQCSKEVGGGMQTVDKGRSFGVSAIDEVRWAACHGKNTIHGEKGSKGLRYYCSAPAEATKKVDTENVEELIESVGEEPAGAALRRTNSTASGALLEGFTQAEQWQASAPAREAAAQAEAARQAEALRKRDENSARQASGSGGWATFFNVLGAAAGVAAQVQTQSASSAYAPAPQSNCIGTQAQCDCLLSKGYWVERDGYCRHSNNQ